MSLPCIEKGYFLDFTNKASDDIAIIHKERIISFGLFSSYVTDLTVKLREAGLQKGDYAALHMSSSVEMVLAVFAVLSCGAVVVPLNTDSTPEHISRILDKSCPKLILYNRGAPPQADYTVKAFSVDIEKLDESTESEKLLVPYNPELPAYCIFTSGSTGEPKGVVLTSRGIVNHIEAKVSLMNLDENSRLCLSFNIGFVASVWQVLTPLMLGARLYLYDSAIIKNTYYFIRLLESDGINVVSLIPHSLYGYCRYIGEVHKKLELKDMKYIILTGEKFDRSVVEKFYEDYDNISLVNAYGQSECSDDTFHYIIPRNDIPSEIPIGKPVNNIYYRILDENRTDVSDGEKGELYIGGVCLAKCYLDNEELTREKFVTVSGIDYFRTGDIVCKNDNGDVVCFGRVDNQVKVNGYRIEPEETELYLNGFPGIERAVVGIVNTNEIDRMLVAYYISTDFINQKEVNEFLASKLPPYMIPSAYLRVSGFLENANGKTDRKRLEKCTVIKRDETSLMEYGLNGLSKIQRRAFEVIVANIDEKLTDMVTPDISFEEMGLDSISFIKIIVALECEFDIEFDGEKLLLNEFPTVKSMMEYTEQVKAQEDTIKNQ